MSDVVTPGAILLGRGEVYFDRFDANGAATGERFVGNCSRFEVTPTDDVRDKFSSAEATAPLIVSTNVRREFEIALTLDEFDKPNVALALMGAEATLSQGSGTVAFPGGENMTARLDRWIAASKRNISAVVVKNSAETTTYVENTDYKVDATRGRIFFISGGAIADAQVLHIAFTYSTVSKDKVQAGTASFINGKIRFVGKPAAGPTWEIEVWKVAIQPDGGLSLLGDDYAEMPIKGRVLADTTGHPTEPYFVAYKLA